MNVLLDCMIVMRMPTVAIPKEASVALVQNPTLAMARSVKVTIIINSLNISITIIVYGVFLFVFFVFFWVAGFRPMIQAANATELGNNYNTTELKCRFFLSNYIIQFSLIISFFIPSEEVFA